MIEMLEYESKCELHNKERKKEELTKREEIKLGFCKQPNAFRCKDNNCAYHVGE